VRGVAIRSQYVIIRSKKKLNKEEIDRFIEEALEASRDIENEKNIIREFEVIDGVLVPVRDIIVVTLT